MRRGRGRKDRTESEQVLWVRSTSPNGSTTYNDSSISEYPIQMDQVTNSRRNKSKSSYLPTVSEKPKEKKTKQKERKARTPDKAKEDFEEQFRHLSVHHAGILKRQVYTPDLKRGMGAIFTYSSRFDKLLMAIGAIFSIGSGAALPLMTLVFGGLQQTFSQFQVGIIDHHELSKVLASYVLYYIYLGAGQFIVTYISTLCFIFTGENIAARLRQGYLESCLRQNIGFFDKVGAGEVVTRITSDTSLIQDGLSEKVAITIGALSTFITAFIIAFANYWKLTLILSSVMLALIVNTLIFSGKMLANSKMSMEANALGSNLAEEVFGSVRNSAAFGTQDRLAEQYDQHISKAEVYGYRLKVSVSYLVAGVMGLLYLSYALAFWQGSSFLLSNEIPLNHLLVVMMTVIMGAFNIGNITPNFQAFSTAIGAMSTLINTIERKSPIDSVSDEGLVLEKVHGNINFIGVSHIYPSRPGAMVMNNVTLDFPAGKNTALVGPSGSGKSTIIGLVERFYNPVEGTIYLDGHDISKLNLRWLRQQMSLVSQEPTLFATSVYENIRFGLIGTGLEHETPAKQRELVISAAKMANAHDFVAALPKGYETDVGDRGFLLSGGQKQRIAIARAVVSDPKILLLDEATSALDTKSEGLVQAALDAASAGRTTITIAHRLSTIKEADNIVVMAGGQVVEQGTHQQLVGMKSAYYNLVSAQNIITAESLSTVEKERLDKAEEMLIRRISLFNPADPVAKLEEGPGLKPHRSIILDKSEASVILQGRAGQMDKTYGTWELLKFIASFNRQETKRMIAGLFFATICGGASITGSVFLAKEILVLTNALNPLADRHKIRDEANFWAVMYIILALAVLGSFASQGVAFASCSERLIHRVRYQAFKALLRQDISFFDKEENKVGALTSFLSTEANNVAGLSGSTLGTILLTSATLVSSMVVALALGWKLGLVCISTIPVLLACGFFRVYLLSEFQRRAKEAYRQSAAYASEAISAIRTVAALTREKDIMQKYREDIAAQRRRNIKSILGSSAVFSASQAGTFFCYALGFWYGGNLMATHEYNLFQFFVCFMGIIYGAQATGSIFSYAPDMSKANRAAQELKRLFDRQPVIDAWSQEGDHLREGEVEGKVEFRDVHFRYPTRLDQPILRGLNLSIEPGQYVALVGASGCGKSTTISLMERFYDPLAGGVYIDGKEISTLNINNYRSHMALVSQEPTLYQGTIRENILLGTPRLDVTDEEIEHVCREANIYDFVISLPEGLNTAVGSKGTLLSGGQKQRIAIARALIRNPKILLLDEATSALDSESETVVQAALDKASHGRTTIAVAHRLSTIQRADVIFVFDQGRVVESGTHSELMRKNGRYAELVNLQSLDSSS